MEARVAIYQSGRIGRHLRHFGYARLPQTLVFQGLLGWHRRVLHDGRGVALLLLSTLWCRRPQLRWRLCGHLADIRGFLAGRV